MLFIDLFAFLLGNVIVINAQTCYYPDGSVSSHDTPCHSISTGDGASACCGYSDICLDNGLCLAQSGAEITSRGSCTDETWQSPQCSQFCEDGNHLFEIPRNLFHRNSCYGLILMLILVLQSIGAAGRLCNSFSTSRNKNNQCSAVALLIYTTTRA